MASPKPYKIDVPNSELEGLQQRLKFTRLPSQLEDNDEWQFGVPVHEVKRLLNHWQDGFDWKKQEKELNRLPHFRTQIEVIGFGVLDVHCK
jgi:hypothetical protein